MRIYVSIGIRLIIAGLVPLLGSHSSWAGDAWPVPPSHLQLTTPYGNLDVKTSEYVYESRLQVNGSDTDPRIEGIINITYSFLMPKAQAALLSINNGSNNCPITYRWIILQSESYKISPAFGSCSNLIKVSVKGRSLTVRTPNVQEKDKIDIYVYDGKTIKQYTQP